MTQRISVALAFVLLVSPAVLPAQTPVPAPPPGSGTVVIRGGASTPGPQTAPPRDGAATSAAPTGTGRIRGRVVAAETGAPLRRAQIRIVSAASAAQNGPPNMQVANTDADGRYEFSNLPAARYTLTVTRSGFVSLQFGQQRPFEPGKPLSLAEGEVAEKIDFALPRGGVIAGKVTDESGEPVPGLRMQAQRYQYMPGGQRRLVAGNMSAGPYSIMTDDLGQFRVYGLTPGSYVLSAVPMTNGVVMITTAAAGVGGASVYPNDGYAATYYPGTANVDEAQTITVATGQETVAYFALVSARMGRISGVVRNSEGERPTARVMVSLRTNFGDGGFTTNGMVTVGADGSFSIANVPPGEHFLDVRPMGGPTQSGSGAQPAADEFASVPVTVAGEDITGVVITTGPGATIAGRMMFEGTSPRPTAPQPLRVGVSPADPGNPTTMMMVMANGQDNGVVDEHGAFQLRGVNGSVLFRTGAQGWNLKSVTLNGIDITDTPFDARPSSNVTGLEITLTDRQTSLSGFARNAQGETMKDFVVAIFPAELKAGAAATRFTRTIRPDQEGRYQVRGLPPGDYVAVAVESLEQGGEWDPAFQQQMRPRAKTFRLNEGQVLTLDLQLIQ